MSTLNFWCLSFPTYKKWKSPKQNKKQCLFMLHVLLILTHTCTNGTLTGILYQWTKCIDNTKDFFSIWLNCVVAWSLSHVQLFVTPWTAAHQASLSFTISQSLLKFKSIELVMLSNHLILCSPLLLLSSILPSIRVFSSESALWIRWPKCYLIIICDLFSLRKCIVSCILYSCFSVISTHSSAFYLLISGSHVLLRRL